MNGKPKISVIMPSLNVGDYIRQCIESVLEQTLKDIEIICIDAGSTDGTLEILQDYAEKDPRIRLLHSDKKSYGYQVNLGFDAASADYVGIVETDDYIAPEMYEKLYTAAVHADYPDIVKSGFFIIRPADGGGETITPYCKVAAETGSILTLAEHYELLRSHPGIWTCIYKKDFLSRRNIRVVEAPGGAWVDVPFLFRTMCEAEKICWVNEPLYYYRRTNPNASIHLKDCSIPMARINECKDYLEENYPQDRQLEKNLLHRAWHYREVVLKNPNCRDEDRKEITRTIKRFHRAVVIRFLLGRQYRSVKKSLRKMMEPWE